MAGSKTKYNEKDFPLLAEGWAREGLLDKQIMKNLGIKKSAFYEYMNTHPEFAEAIKRGRRPVNIEVENALLKRALGYEIDEKTTDVDLNQASGQSNVVRIRTVKKHVPGDVGAMAFWLKNKKKEDWKDRHSHEHSGEDGKAIPVDAKTTLDIDYSKLPTEVLLAIVNASKPNDNP